MKRNVLESLYHAVNPGHKEGDFHENVGNLVVVALVLLCEDHHTLELAVADERSTRVSLQQNKEPLGRCVSASVMSAAHSCGVPGRSRPSFCQIWYKSSEVCESVPAKCACIHG